MRSVAAIPAPDGSVYDQLRALTKERCLILDGRSGLAQERSRALLEDPHKVTELHRRYVDAGADVITATGWEPVPRAPSHWMERARRGVRLAREAAGPHTAVALAIDAQALKSDGSETIDLVSRALAPAPPDLVLLEGLSTVRPSLFATVEALLAAGLPVWLSFRRCRHGLCGVHGQHWGGPEGDEFGRAARRFEQLGVDALLLNGIPPDHVDGTVAYLKEFTDLPLGVYPNLGYRTRAGWRHEAGTTPEDYAGQALNWRAEGAQIVGGHSGVTPEHVQAVRDALAGAPQGRRTPRRTARIPAHPEPWQDHDKRDLFPLPLPDVAGDPDVCRPSLVTWSHLYKHRIGSDRRCLDIGSGTGLQAIQLALNGATMVEALDCDKTSVALTRTNAFRNGVADRVHVDTIDLFDWRPEQRYDVIVATLQQLPVHPDDAAALGRRPDFWGRNALDHLIAQILPDALADQGTAYVSHLSLLSQERTAELLARHGLRARVADFGFHPLNPSAQVACVERLSDAYHLRVAGDDLTVAYLLEITRAPRRARRAS